MKKTLAAFLLLCTMGMAAPSLPDISRWFADVIAKVCTKVPQPTDAPGAGTYVATQSVTLADTYGGSTLYVCYTLDGTTPYASYNGSVWACGNGTHYTGAFNISATSTLKAVGCATNYSCSSLDSSLYTIQSLLLKGKTTGYCFAATTDCAASYTPNATNDLVVVGSYFLTTGTGTTSVTDDATGGSSTYTSGATISPWAGGNGTANISYVCQVKSGATHIHVHPSASSGLVMFTVLDYSGAQATGCGDVFTSSLNTSTGTLAAANSLTPNFATEVIDGFFWSNVETTFSTSGSWTEEESFQDTNIQGYTFGATDQVISGITGYTASAALPSNLWIAMAGSFH